MRECMGANSVSPGTRNVERLMCSGPKRPKDGSAKLLVKGEWDKAEDWLKKEEVNRIINLPQNPCDIYLI